MYDALLWSKICMLIIHYEAKTLMTFFICDKSLTKNEIASEDAEINDSWIEDVTRKETSNRGPCRFSPRLWTPPFLDVTPLGCRRSRTSPFVDDAIRGHRCSRMQPFEAAAVWGCRWSKMICNSAKWFWKPKMLHLIINDPMEELRYTLVRRLTLISQRGSKASKFACH